MNGGLSKSKKIMGILDFGGTPPHMDLINLNTILLANMQVRGLWNAVRPPSFAFNNN